MCKRLFYSIGFVVPIGLVLANPANASTKKGGNHNANV
jgi:hypothetical protein